MYHASKVSCLKGVRERSPRKIFGFFAYQTCGDIIWGAINDKIHFPDLELDDEFITISNIQKSELLNQFLHLQLTCNSSQSLNCHSNAQLLSMSR